MDKPSFPLARHQWHASHFEAIVKNTGVLLYKMVIDNQK